MREKELTVDKLERELEESQVECARYRRQLRVAVDKLAELGAIDNLPHTKWQFVTGERELV